MMAVLLGQLLSQGGLVEHVTMLRVAYIMWVIIMKPLLGIIIKIKEKQELCKEKDKTVSHLMSECSSIA